MAAGKELFKLFGLIGMQGVEKTQKQIKGVDKQVRKTQKEFERLGRRVSDVGKVLTKAFTVPLLIAAAASVKFINDASDLNETIAKTGEIFGESAKEIEKWAETSATKLGQSQDQAMDAAATFAIFGQSAGLAGKDLVKFSTEFVELASDMASFFNTEPAQAITAIGAAFRGENEPIRKYGILLDDATLRNKAFELGLITTTKKALLPQTKVLAAQAVIMEQSAIAQGDFARTAKGLANQKRILAAQIKNVSATLGQLFLPAALKAGTMISRLVGFAERLINAWKSLDPSTKKTVKGFLLIAAALGPGVFLVGKFITSSKILIPLLVALKSGTLSYAGAVAILQKSVLGITLLIGALVAVGWFWFSQWDQISIQLKAIWADVALSFTRGAFAIIQALADVILNGIKLLDKLSDVVPGLSEKLKKATIGIIKFKGELFNSLGIAEIYARTLWDQAAATQSFTDSLKQAVKDGKALLGIQEEGIKKTQKQIDQEKEGARLAAENAKKVLKFNADILDQTIKVGADKFALLAIEREKAVAEAERLGADVLAVKELFAAKEKELLAEDETVRQEFNAMNKKQLESALLTKLELLEIEKQETLLKAEELGAQKFEILGLFALREQELRDQIRKEEEAKDKRALVDRLNTTSKIGNKLNNVLAKFSDNKLQRLNIQERKEIEAIENSQLTEEEKEVAIQKIQEETEKKRRVMERQRAIREKFAALFNIGINTASAVVEALPNLVLASIVGGLGLAEGVAVATAPLPFFEGALVEGSDLGVNAIIGEDNQDEIVFPIEKGIGLFIDGLVDRLGELELPTFGAPALAGVAAAGPASEIHMHVGVLIADKRGLKELERKLDTVRIEENQRKGF